MKKIYLSAILLSAQFMNFAMNNDDLKFNGRKQIEITAPYTPSILVRYPRLITLGLGGMSYLIGNYGQEKVNPAYLGAAGLVAGYFLTRKTQLIDSLLLNPIEGLQHAYSIHEKFSQEGNKKDLDNKPLAEMKPEFEKLKNKYEQQSPIFLVGECIQEGFGPCLLSRTYDPRYRTAFENKIAQAVLTKLQTTAAPLNYVSFAHGGMYQDLVIFAKILAKNPNANLNIHFIDIQNTPYVKARSLLGNGREISQTYCIDIDPCRDKLVACAKKKGGAQGKDSVIADNLDRTCILAESRFKEVVNFLQKTFPKAHLSLQIHSSSENYLKYREKNNLPLPDIVTAADIQDDMSCMKKAPAHYMTLCAKVQKNNSLMMNYWLAKNDNKAQIVSLSTSKVENAASGEIDIGNNEKVLVYFSEEDLD